MFRPTCTGVYSQMHVDTQAEYLFYFVRFLAQTEIAGVLCNIYNSKFHENSPGFSRVATLIQRD